MRVVRLAVQEEIEEGDHWAPTVGQIRKRCVRIVRAEGGGELPPPPERLPPPTAAERARMRWHYQEMKRRLEGKPAREVPTDWGAATDEEATNAAFAALGPDPVDLDDPPPIGHEEDG